MVVSNDAILSMLALLSRQRIYVAYGGILQLILLVLRVVHVVCENVILTSKVTNGSSTLTSHYYQDRQATHTRTKVSFAIDFSIEKFENRSHVRYPHSFYQCVAGEKRRNMKLGQRGARDWSSLQRQPIKTRITASGLNIAIVGDSLSKQVYDVLFDALGMNHSLEIYSKVPDGRIMSAAASGETRRSNSNDHDPSLLVYFQSIGMLVPDQENLTWSREDWTNVEAAIPFIGPSSSSSWNPIHQQRYKNHTTQKHYPMDVCLFRPPFPWIGLDAITDESLQQSIALLQQLLRCTFILLLTIPYSNNVINNAMYNQLVETNQLIRTTATSEHHHSSVHLLDYELLTRNLMIQNAAALGIPTNETFTKRLTTSHYRALESAICRESQPVGTHVCPSNMLSIDGMHWCLETVGGYLAAAVACHTRCRMDTKCHQQWHATYYADIRKATD